MTLPNKLTIGRILFTPSAFILWYVFFVQNLSERAGSLILWGVFILCELSDLLDGWIARKHKLITDLGKLLDPFADVLLHVTFFICFIGAGLMPLWTFLVILWRELCILFLRMLLIRSGTVLAANKGGKAKSFLYFVSCVAGLITLTLRAWTPDTQVLLIFEKAVPFLYALAALAAVVSFVNYLGGFKKSGAWDSISR